MLQQSDTRTSPEWHTCNYNNLFNQQINNNYDNNYDEQLLIINFKLKVNFQL